MNDHLFNMSPYKTIYSCSWSLLVKSMPHLMFNYIRHVQTNAHANIFKMSTKISLSQIVDWPPTVHPITTPLMQMTNHHHSDTHQVQLHHLLSIPLGDPQHATLPLLGSKSHCHHFFYHHSLATQMAESTLACLHCLMHHHKQMSRATAIMVYTPPLNGVVLLQLLVLNNNPLPSSQLHSHHFSGLTIRCQLAVQKLTNTSIISAKLSSSLVMNSLQQSVPKMLCAIWKHRLSRAIRYGKVPARK